MDKAITLAKLDALFECFGTCAKSLPLSTGGFRKDRTIKKDRRERGKPNKNQKLEKNASKKVTVTCLPNAGRILQSNTTNAYVLSMGGASWNPTPNPVNVNNSGSTI